MIEIVNGDHDPPHPFMIVDRFGMHVDLTNVQGELWDPKTVTRITWGLRDNGGQTFGLVQLKSGQSRRFYVQDLMTPYVNAYWLAREDRHGDEDPSHEAGPNLSRVRPAQSFR